MEAAPAAVDETMEAPAAAEETKKAALTSRDAIMDDAANRILDLQEKGPVPPEVEAAIWDEAANTIFELECPEDAARLKELKKLKAEGLIADESSESEEDLSAKAAAEEDVAAAADAEAAGAEMTLADFP
jgi:hypothetical protein